MRNLPLSLLACLAALFLLSADTKAQEGEAEAWAHLPEPVTNNAVAGAMVDGRAMAYSFAGLHEGKTWRDVTADAYACDLEARECREIDGLPDGIGRLAAVAVNVGGQIYIFGGYTVAEDGSEASTPEVWRFDPALESYTHITSMPVPVDDTIALPFEDRYIYLVSGWHDTDNVDLVQVYDVEEDIWFEATPFPGAPVFGHAGAMDSSGRILICGGTAVIPPIEEGARRSFEAIADCWVGRVEEDVSQISWVSAGPVPGGPFYRGIIVPRNSLSGFGAVLIGGSDNAYNYNGIGYDGRPVEPRGDRMQAFTRLVEPCDPDSVVVEWPNITMKNEGTQIMDIRGAAHGYTLGGMSHGQIVSDRVLPTFSLETDLINTRINRCVTGE